MAGTIRARVRSGMLEPLEKLDFPEGKELTLTILELPSGLEKDAFLRSAGAWKGLVDADELVKNIYADRLTSPRPEPRL